MSAPFILQLSELSGLEAPTEIKNAHFHLRSFFSLGVLRRIIPSITPQGLLLVAIVLLGFFLRLNRYIANNSVWLDEAALAVSIVERSPTDLLQPLAYGQVAPLGFLQSVKALTLIFGIQEQVLRLIPLLAGLASLILFANLAKRLFGEYLLLVAVLLFAASDHLIAWSVQFKQYSTDVFFALLMVSAVIPLRTNNPRSKVLLGMGLVGLIGVAFSQPIVFVLASIAVVEIYNAVRRRDRRGLISWVILSTFWLAAFGFLFFFYYRSSLGNAELEKYWSFAFPGISSNLMKMFEKWLGFYFGVFQDPLGFNLRGGVALVFMLGAVELIRKNSHQAVILLLPGLLAFAAALLNLYPFNGRLLLFLAPFWILVIVYGIQLVLPESKKVSRVVLLGVLALMIYDPIKIGIARGLHPRLGEEMRPVVTYLAQNYKAGDEIYVYYASEPAFRYYNALLAFEPDEGYYLGVASREEPDLYHRDIDQLRGSRRLWLVFSHVFSGSRGDERELILKYVRANGALLDQLSSSGSGLFLFDFFERGNKAEVET